MPVLDSKKIFDTAHDLTGTSAVLSTNEIDTGYAEKMKGGKQMFVVVEIETTAGGTTPTLSIALQDSADASTYATILTTETFAAAALVAGAKIAKIPVPPDHRRYLQIAYTQGGTSPTVSVNAYLMADIGDW